MLEISKMLTIGTAHIQKETADMLSLDAQEVENLPTYEWEEVDAA